MLLKLDGLFDDDDNEVVRGLPSFYHYKCDGHDDRGWGCGYRTLQTLCSWVIDVQREYSTPKVPSIDEIQQILVRLEDKPESFLESNQWIGTCEAAMVLSELYQVNRHPVHNFSSHRFRSIVKFDTLPTVANSLSTWMPYLNTCVTLVRPS
jgi:hypothetical protein